MFFAAAIAAAKPNSTLSVLFLAGTAALAFLGALVFVVLYAEYTPPIPFISIVPTSLMFCLVVIEEKRVKTLPNLLARLFGYRFPF